MDLFLQLEDLTLTDKSRGISYIADFFLQSAVVSKFYTGGKCDKIKSGGVLSNKRFIFQSAMVNKSL